MMSKHPAIGVAILLLLLSSALASAQTDRVRLVGGGSEAGQIVSTSPAGVTLETGGGREDVPVVAIRSVLFADEPVELTQARINTNNGGFETALEKLEQIEVRDVDRDLIRQDIKFYKAYCEARLAMVGTGDAGAAGRNLNAFRRDNRDSFHEYAALETLGDLLVSVGRHDQAAKMYGQLAEAPHESLRMRARLLIGRALQADGNHGEAIARFDAVLSSQADEPGADEQRLAARLGKAASLAATGELEAGLKLTRSVLSQAGDEDAALQATGYNTLGRCYEAAGKPLDALFAYLHTDLLFSGDPETHAEALSRLAVLWRENGKPDEAREALARLRRQYAASKWAREAG